MNRTIWACWALLLGWGVTRAADTVYVDHRRGSDRRDGVTREVRGHAVGPLRTVQAALRRVSPGGRIVVLPSRTPIKESFVVDGSRPRDFAGRPLVIDGGNQTWAGWEPVPDEWTYDSPGIFRLSRPTQTYTQLFRASPFGAIVQGSLPPSAALLPGTATRWGTYLYFRGIGFDSPATLGLVASSRPGAIVVHGASHVVLRNFHFQAYRICAVEVRGPCSDVTMEDCRLEHVGKTGVIVAQGAEVDIVRLHAGAGVPTVAIARDSSLLTMHDVEVEGDTRRFDEQEGGEVKDHGPPATKSLAPPAEASPKESMEGTPDPLPEAESQLPQ